MGVYVHMNLTCKIVTSIFILEFIFSKYKNYRISKLESIDKYMEYLKKLTRLMLQN